MSVSGPDITAVKVHFPQDGQIQIHQLPGNPPKWVDTTLLNEKDMDDDSVNVPIELSGLEDVNDEDASSSTDGSSSSTETTKK